MSCIKLIVNLKTGKQYAMNIASHNTDLDPAISTISTGATWQAVCFVNEGMDAEAPTAKQCPSPLFSSTNRANAIDHKL